MYQFFKQKNIVYKKRRLKSVSGFTLVEALVAIAIFTGSILALVSILSGNVADTTHVKQRIIASYLAQEGIEYMRNMRDTYVLYEDANTNGWNEFQVKLSVCDEATPSLGCYFDPQNIDFADDDRPMTGIDVNICPNGICPELLYNEAVLGSSYTYVSGGSPSGFIRRINKKQISTDEMEVTSTVFWSQGSGDYEVSFSDNFFNWTK